LRRFGSAAIDLCYVACGRLDGFWELNLKPYDIAAGKLILEEAGGTYSDFEGRNHHQAGEVLASNGLLHSKISNIIKSVKKSYER
jgi:myo-inositol-1(or 4)-monophosphatase